MIKKLYSIRDSKNTNDKERIKAITQSHYTIDRKWTR